MTDLPDTRGRKLYLKRKSCGCKNIWVRVNNKFKTKLKWVFLQNCFKYRKNSQLFLKKCPRKSLANAFQSFIYRQENMTAT